MKANEKVKFQQLLKNCLYVNFVSDDRGRGVERNNNRNPEVLLYTSFLCQLFLPHYDKIPDLDYLTAGNVCFACIVVLCVGRCFHLVLDRQQRKQARELEYSQLVSYSFQRAHPLSLSEHSQTALLDAKTWVNMEAHGGCFI